MLQCPRLTARTSLLRCAARDPQCDLTAMRRVSMRPMIRRRDLDEISGAARLEQQSDIAFQRRLVVCHRQGTYFFWA